VGFGSEITAEIGVVFNRKLMTCVRNEAFSGSLQKREFRKNSLPALGMSLFSVPCKLLILKDGKIGVISHLGFFDSLTSLQNFLFKYLSHNI
jgi:hypothetical protein